MGQTTSFLQYSESTTNAVRADAEWKAWQQDLWAEYYDRADSRSKLPHELMGMDPTTFTSLTEWPHLQARCVAHWSEFTRWWQVAKPLRVAEVNKIAVYSAQSGIRGS